MHRSPSSNLLNSLSFVLDGYVPLAIEPKKRLKVCANYARQRQSLPLNIQRDGWAWAQVLHHTVRWQEGCPTTDARGCKPASVRN